MSSALIVSVWLNWLLSLVFLYVFNCGLLVLMSCVNDRKNNNNHKDKVKVLQNAD